MTLRQQPPGRISRAQLVDARDTFHDLLARRTREADWQRFFTTHPYVLSSTLPLALDPRDIIPAARPGQAEPDFLFYPQEGPEIPFYGVVELKRPESRIVTVTRSNVALLTRSAETAVEQSKVYVDELGRRLRHAERNLLCLGNGAYIFIIMGLRREISEKLGVKLFNKQIAERLPKNVTLLPYDTVFERFDQKVPAKLMILVPREPVPDEALQEALRNLSAEEEELWESMNCG